MSKTIKFNPSIPQRKENIYMEQFFSGADCNVYIDGVLCENVAGISFQLQEQLKPIYGYASRAYDDVAIGNRIVTGVLQLPLVSTEEAVTSICDAMNQSPSESSISSVSSSSVPYNTNVFEVKSVPSWVSAWMTEYGYSTEEATGSLVPAELGDIFTKAEYDAQIKLKSLGYDVAPTGVTDVKVQKAILGFQISNGISASGTLDDVTKALLYGETEEAFPISFIEDSEIRTGPSVSYPVFYESTEGEIGDLLKEMGEYSKVRLLDGRTGYTKTSKIILSEGGQH